MTHSPKGDSERPIALARLVAHHTHDENIRRECLALATELEQLLEAQEHERT